MSWWQEPTRRRPGPSAPRAKGRRPFGATWWGAAWVEALEQRARLDTNRLPRGRSYARSGAVGELHLAAGEVTAAVQGSRARPYQVRVRVRTFATPEWDRVLDALVAEIGHTAALLDGELPPDVADDVRAAGLELLPGAGEVQPRCTCPDWADPCKHAAAVCYLVADAVDDDPFGLFTLRGRTRDEVLAGLRARRRRDAVPALEPDALEVDPGVRATSAWARALAPLPAPAEPPRHPGLPTVLGSDPPAGAGIDMVALRGLAADAAARALSLARGAPSSGLELTLDEDLARRAAAALGGQGQDVADLARRAGMAPRELLRWALAWREGGPEGLAVTRVPWDPPVTAVAAGRAALGPRSSARRNRVTLGDSQIRLGTDGRWYPFRKGGSAGWDPDGPPFDLDVEELDTGEAGGAPPAAHRSGRSGRPKAAKGGRGPAMPAETEGVLP